jgi:hypothetical protein
MAELKIIKVKSNLANKAQVALWEQNVAHPKSDRFPDGGEIFIADDKEHSVAETPAVVLAIKDDKLVKVGGDSQIAAAPKSDAPTTTTGSGRSR